MLHGLWELPLTLVLPLTSITFCFTIAHPCLILTCLQISLKESEGEKKELAFQLPIPPQDYLGLYTAKTLLCSNSLKILLV